MAAFSKKYLREISILGINESISGKNKGTIDITTYKMDTIKVTFFWFFTTSLLKLRFVLNTFLTKILKSSHRGIVKSRNKPRSYNLHVHTLDRKILV